MLRISACQCWRVIWIALALLVNSSSSDTTKSQPKKKQSLSNDDRSPADLNVVELTSKTFSSNVGDGNVWLVEFYTPWCRHCQDFADSYSSIAATFHSSPSEDIRVAKVDCAVEKALVSRFGVRSFPSFYLIDGWSVYEFEEKRSYAKLLDFVRGGYKKHEPIPLWSSPMGPMGLLQGSFIIIGAQVMDFFHNLQEVHGVSPILAGVILSFLAVIGGMFSIVFLVMVTTPKVKND